MSGTFGNINVDPDFIKELEIILEELRILDISSGIHPVFSTTYTRKIREKKCECGAEKCKTTHSDWCPKYEE